MPSSIARGSSSSTTGAEPELVDLEEPEVAVELAPAAARGVGQRGGDAAGHVRAGAVVDEPARRVRSRIDATIAAVVVLPLVAEMTTLPCSSRAASRPIACGSTRVSTLPGSDVPPPRPARRASAPTAWAAATLAASSAHGTITRSAPGCTRTVAGQVGDRVAVGVGT